MKGCIIMEKTPKEMLKAYVDSQKFNSTTEIMDAMKEMFRDALFSPIISFSTPICALTRS